ncbi:MAG: aspartyl-trna synthetase [Amylibacter sp.]|nr:aspartyl-trna synthetase [Amylibacter sp.]
MATLKIKPLLAGVMAVVLFSFPVVSAETKRGAVTNLPVPRFVSMKAKEGNARRGPGLTYRIDWVFQHTNMPLLITAEFGHWRRVQDKDGQGGWMHYALLSGVRTVIVNKPDITLRIKPNLQAAPAAYAQEGAIVSLKECLPDWCSIASKGRKGWALKTDLWGVGAKELRD